MLTLHVFANPGEANIFISQDNMKGIHRDDIYLSEKVDQPSYGKYYRIQIRMVPIFALCYGRVIMVELEDFKQMIVIQGEFYQYLKWKSNIMLRESF
jgi:hypothetical protein